MTGKEVSLRIGGALVSTILALFFVVRVLHLDSGLLSLVITITIWLLVFANKLAGAGPKLLCAFGLTALVMLLINWSFTGPTAWWLIGKARENAPRDYFDSKTGQPKVKVRGEVPFDGHDFPPDYNYDPIHGVALRPITPEDVANRIDEDASEEGAPRRNYIIDELVHLQDGQLSRVYYTDPPANNPYAWQHGSEPLSGCVIYIMNGETLTFQQGGKRNPYKDCAGSSEGHHLVSGVIPNTVQVKAVDGPAVVRIRVWETPIP